MSNWNIIRDKRIIELLIGNVSLKKGFTNEKVKMPYMSGVEICNFGKKFGCEINYNNEKQSRWQYMDRVIEFVINKQKMNDFFKELTLKKRFTYLADDYSYFDSPEELYWEIIHSLFLRINEYLGFQDLYINYDIKKSSYSLNKYDNELEKNTEHDKTFSEIIKTFCKNIKEEGFETKYGKITNITDPGKQGGNGKILFGSLNGKDVVIKILLSEEKKKRLRFFEEFINVLMSLEKVDGVVELYLYDTILIEEKEIQYIVMKKYNSNLENTIIDNQDDLFSFALELAKIISNVHNNGIIHRDIKPANILLDNNNNIVLTDFGIAFFDPEEFEYTGHTISKEYLGNRLFSAPEQLRKGAKPKVTMDIYSYGEILQYVVTSSPHTGTGREKIGKYISGNNIVIIDDIIDKCLNFEPKKRFQTMEEIINCLLEAKDAEKTKLKKDQEIDTNIDSNKIYEYICINDMATTKELADFYNYDMHLLKSELMRLYKLKRIIKPESLSDIPEEDECKWVPYY